MQKKKTLNSDAIRRSPLRKIIIISIILIGIYVLSLFIRPFSAYSWYPIAVVKCGGYPVMGSTFAAGRSYTTPNNILDVYGVSYLSQPEYYFCSIEEAEKKGFRPSLGEPNRKVY